MGIAPIMAVAVAAASPVIVIGPGNESCGRWLEARRADDASMIAFSAWLAGYLSAVNQYGDVGDILGGKRLEDARLFMDNYCRQYPIRTVKHAADSLISTLMAPK